MSSPHSPMMSRVLRRIARQLTTRRAVAPRKTFSATDRCGTIIECWNTVAIHSRQRPMSPTRGAGSPPNRTVPASGSDRPDRIETRVDLPAPFRPTRPRHCPAAMERSTPRRARVVPNRFSTPVTSTSAPAREDAAPESNGLAEVMAMASPGNGVAGARQGAGHRAG